MKKAFKNLGRAVKVSSGLEEIRLLNQQHTLLLNELRHDFLLANPRYQDPKRLNRHEYQALSQFGEDGIISEIFRRIGTTNKYFAEFGAGDGIENNSAALLLKGWNGFWIEGSPASSRLIRKHFSRFISEGRLAFKESFVTRENIEALFAEAKVPKEFDLFSIDIDGNDYWVWKEIKNYSPRVVIAEFNGTFGPEIEWVMKHNPDHAFDNTQYFGSSLKAYEKRFAEKGYRLVGCGLAGINAFFVRQDLATEDKFLAPFTSENHYEPPRYYLYSS